MLSYLAVATVLLRLANAVDPPCVATDPSTPEAICANRAAFGGSLVVPEVIPSFLPTGILHVQYGTVDVGGAQQLSPARVGSQPVISFMPVAAAPKSGPVYTLVMVDADAGANSDVLHWMQTGLTLAATTGLLTSTVAAAAPYGGPAPPQGTGPHRYTLLLYTEPAGFKVPSFPATIGGTRLGFDFAAFLAGSGLGDPVGGNFFKSTFDGTTGTNTGAAPALSTSTAVAASGAASRSGAAASTVTSAPTMTTAKSAASAATPTPSSSTGMGATPAASSGSSRFAGITFGFALWTFGLGSGLAFLELVM